MMVYIILTNVHFVSERRHVADELRIEAPLACLASFSFILPFFERTVSRTALLILAFYINLSGTFLAQLSMFYRASKT